MSHFVLKGSDDPYLPVLKQWYPKHHDILIYLRDNPQLTYSEASKALNIPVNTIKTRLHRARMKIMEWRTADILKQKLTEAP